MTQGATRARVLQWFVRGGVARTPDGHEIAVYSGRFRSDLFFRIAPVRVELPALRERLDDLPLLVANVAQVAATLADTPEAIDDVLTLARGSVAGEPQRPQTAFAEAKRGSIASFDREYLTQLSRASKGTVSERNGAAPRPRLSPQVRYREGVT
jgi:hypothetical protein